MTAPGALGSFQVLFNHAPLLSLLTPGQLTVRSLSGEETLYSVGGGFAEVRDNHVVILADSAERADEINTERAETARDVADDVLRARAPGTTSRRLTRPSLGRSHDCESHEKR